MKWTKTNVNRLIKLHKSGLKTREIAEKLNRTVSSVSGKINTLQQRGELPYKHKGKKSVKDVIKEKKTTKVNKHPAWKADRKVGEYQKLMKMYQQQKPKQKPTNLDSSARKINDKMLEITKMLQSKNDAYGDSALAPIRVFSKSDGQEQLKVRIDDKLNRLIQGNDSIESDKDVILDLVGYLVLLLIAMDDY